MDYTSFAPGQSANNQNLTPPVLPAVPSQKSFKPKFIALVVLLLLIGGGAYAGIWYWQNQQLSQEAVPTFTPRPQTTEGQFCGGIATGAFPCPTGYSCKLDGTYPDAGGKCVADTSTWKTYMNTSDILFSIQYPVGWKYSNRNDNGKIYSVSLSGAEGDINVVWGDGFGGAYCMDPDNLGLQIKMISLGQTGLKGCVEKNKAGINDWVFFKDISTGLTIKVSASSNSVSGNDMVDQILSTFRFTSSNPGQTACTQEAKQCPNGTYVGRTGPNCEFAICPK